MAGCSFYVTEPAHENHTNRLSGGKIIIKTGIFKGRKNKKNAQKYVNRRYMLSRLYLHSYKSNFTYQKMMEVERSVLLELKKCYTKQYGKKEHFIIPSNAASVMKFVQTVVELYRRLS